MTMLAQRMTEAAQVAAGYIGPGWISIEVQPQVFVVRGTVSERTCVLRSITMSQVEAGRKNLLRTVVEKVREEMDRVV